MRALLIIGLLTSSGGVLANSFEFAGLSRATTPQDVAKRYPNSTLSGNYVRVSPKDTHDHIFGIELFGPKLSYRLRISFESPDRQYPRCDVIERSIVSRHGPASEVREFREEAAQNRYSVWKLERETVQLQCFKFDKNAVYVAEAIAVHPSELQRAPSNLEYTVIRESENQHKAKLKAFLESKIESQSNAVVNTIQAGSTHLGKSIGQVLPPGSIKEIFVPYPSINSSQGFDLSNESIRSLFDKCVFISESKFGHYHLAPWKTLIATTNAHERVDIQIMLGGNLGRIRFKDMGLIPFECAK